MRSVNLMSYNLGSFITAATARSKAILALTLALAVAPVVGGSSSAEAAQKKAAAPAAPVCVLALNASSVLAVDASAGSAIYGFNCNVQVNSSSALAVNLVGESSITSGGNCVVGKVYTPAGSGSSVNPAPQATCKPVADPYAAKTFSGIGACDYNNLVINRLTVLRPGVYCGVTTMTNATVLMSPGNYVFKDGQINAIGSTIFGNRVSILLTGRYPGIYSGTGTQWILRSTTAGPLAGFAVYMDPNATYPATIVTLAGRSAFVTDGTLYFPKQTVMMTAGSAIVSQSQTYGLIADRLVMTGTSRILSNGDTSRIDLSVLDELPNFETLMPILDALNL